VASCYDIFSGKYGSKDAHWVESTEGRGNACMRMKELAAENRGCYFVFCHETHRILAHIDTTIPKREPRRNCV
jgi:hypothetical protein